MQSQTRRYVGHYLLLNVLLIDSAMSRRGERTWPRYYAGKPVRFAGDNSSIT